MINKNFWQNSIVLFFLGALLIPAGAVLMTPGLAAA